MRRFPVVVVSALAVLGTMNLSLFAAAVTKVTVRGELLDMACYTTKNMTGRQHGKTCGKACLASGLPAGVLVHGQAWTLLTNPKPLARYVGRQVKVVGKEDAKDKVLFPTKIFWKMGAMWMPVKLRDFLHH